MQYTSLICNKTGRFAHTFKIGKEYRVRYGKDTNHGNMIASLDEDTAADLSLMWIDGCDTTKMDEAISAL